MPALSPELINAIGSFVEIAIKIGITEGPEIAQMISAAVHGSDPLAALAKERVDDILPGLQLELAIHAEHVRRAHLAMVGA